MGIVEIPLIRTGLGVDSRVKAPEETEFSHFGYFGDFGLVELAAEGGVYLDVVQLRLFRERDSLKGLSVVRQEDGRYLLNVRKLSPNEKINSG